MQETRSGCSHNRINRCGEQGLSRHHFFFRKKGKVIPTGSVGRGAMRLILTGVVLLAGSLQRSAPEAHLVENFLWLMSTSLSETVPQ